jgi:heme/copper-type cytochrome/quinol oxidase subunit 2
MIKKTEEKQDIWKTLSGVIAMLIIITVLVIAVVIYYNVLKLGYKRDFDKANYNEKLYMLFLRILRLLKRRASR